MKYADLLELAKLKIELLKQKKNLTWDDIQEVIDVLDKIQNELRDDR